MWDEPTGAEIIGSQYKDRARFIAWWVEKYRARHPETADILTLAIEIQNDLKSEDWDFNTVDEKEQRLIEMFQKIGGNWSPFGSI